MSEHEGMTSGQGGGFDDDRLLAFVLDLDPDPELEAAAADDDVLRRRLEAMRAQVAAVEDGVRSVVPEPDAAYADLSDARWTELRDVIGGDRPAAPRHRRSRWLRVALPVATAVAALAVGIVAVERQGDGVTRSTDSAGEAALSVSSPAASGATVATLADQYEVAALARAQAVDGAFQRFAVVRVLKGEAPATLRLEVGDAPATRGRLLLLFLRPLSGTIMGGSASSGGDASAPGAASPAKGGAGVATQRVYTDGDQPVVARELPSGTDPDTYELP